MRLMSFAEGPGTVQLLISVLLERQNLFVSLYISLTYGIKVKTRTYKL